MYPWDAVYTQEREVIQTSLFNIPTSMDTSDIINIFKNLKNLFWNDFTKDNLLVLFSNTFLSITASILFSTVFGTPRLHSTIKTWSETLTRVHFAFFTYYAYLFITYNNAREVLLFLSIGFVLLALSGHFTRRINTNLRFHTCTFTKKYCESHEKKTCSLKELIVDPNQCETPVEYIEAFNVIRSNIFISLIGLLTALISCFYFTK